jgi:AcrR family transcriptional regulator
VCGYENIVCWWGMTRPTAAGLRPPRELAVQRGLARQVDDALSSVDALMAAGRELLQRDGELDFNIRELLGLAGVSNRAFYRYFPTKDALVAALAAEVYQHLLVTQAAAVRAHPEPTDQLAAWIDDALSRAHDPQLAARGRVFVAHEAKLRERHSELYRAVGREMSDEVAAIIRRGRASKAFRLSAGREQARLVVRLTIATLQQHVLAGTAPSTAERDSLVAFAIAGCR